MAGLYIHIPYCHSKCSYCDFFSTPKRDHIHEYISALIAESELRKDEITEPYTTLYIGGGTPSILSLNEIARIISKFKTDNMTELTIEANPEDINVEWAKAIADMGINRVSVGLQSFIDSELISINRNHTAQQSLYAIETLRKSSITEISGDLIYGLPGQTLDSWKFSLNALLSLKLPHISAYSLSYEPGTKLYAKLMSGKIRETEDDTIVAMYQALISETKSMGYNHYEISNFSLPNHQSQHNSSYWHETPYLGLGVSAHSFDGKYRRYNPVNILNYIKMIGAGKTIYEIDAETPENRYNDHIITALRTSEGINLAKMSKKYDTDNLLKEASSHITNGTLILEDNCLKFKEDAWLISDSVLRDLIIV